METRIKYIKTPKNGWLYAIQVKKWLYWKTIETYATFEGAERFLNTLKEIDDFNGKTKSLNKIVCDGWAVRNTSISNSIKFFESYPSRRKSYTDNSKIIWVDANGQNIPTMDINIEELFGKECLDPMKLRITIEQIEE